MGGNSRAAVRRAARHGDGWIPWELTPESCAAALTFARRERAAAARPEAFEVIAPLGVDPAASADAVVAAAARWRSAGATGFHVGIAASSFAEYLGRLDWLGRDVMPHVS